MLALIAGSGRLPQEILRHADALVCAYDGAEPEGVPVNTRFRIETLGSLLDKLQEGGISRVCFAGGIDRPVLDPNAIDDATKPLVPDLLAALGKGDDGALRQVAQVFETRGLEIVAAHALAPHLLPETGVLTATRPNEAAQKDAARARSVVDLVSQEDIGQSCVVARGQILSMEGQFGTQWMLQSLTARPDTGGGVLFKGPKVGQDRRFDLPVIGPETVAQVAAARLEGIVLDHGGVMVLDLEAVVAACNQAGLFLWVQEAGEAGPKCGSS